MCQCYVKPRCESNRCCEDQETQIGIRDPRTGMVRAPAAWSIPLKGRSPFPRVRFYCNECLADYDEALKHPIKGIDPPHGASDDWRPSITDMVRHADMEIRRQERALTKRPQLLDQEPRRWCDYTPQQLEQARFLRRKMRQLRDPGEQSP